LPSTIRTPPSGSSCSRATARTRPVCCATSDVATPARSPTSGSRRASSGRTLERVEPLLRLEVARFVGREEHLELAARRVAVPYTDGQIGDQTPDPEVVFVVPVPPFSEDLAEDLQTLRAPAGVS